MIKQHSQVTKKQKQQIVNRLMLNGVHKHVYPTVSQDKLSLSTNDLQSAPNIPLQSPILSHMPISLIPFHLSAHSYSLIKGLHQIWQSQIVAMATNVPYVESVLKQVVLGDQFVRKFVDINQRVFQWGSSVQQCNNSIGSAHLTVGSDHLAVESKSNVNNQKTTTNNYSNRPPIQPYQPISLQTTFHPAHKPGIFLTRVDYMNRNNPKLIEYNTMSVGLCGMSDLVQELWTNGGDKWWEEMKGIGGSDIQGRGKGTQGQNGKTSKKAKDLQNNQIEQLGCSTNQPALHPYPHFESQKIFCSLYNQCLQINRRFNTNRLIIMVIHERQFNFGDQNAFIRQMHQLGYKTIRLTMRDIYQKVEWKTIGVGGEKGLQNQQGLNSYHIKDNHSAPHPTIPYYQNQQISSFYFRTLYSPSHFESTQYTSSQTIWCLRQLMEMSTAICVPSIPVQLVNFKRFQVEFNTRCTQLKQVVGECIGFDIRTGDKGKANKQINENSNILQQQTISNKSLAEALELAKSGQYVLKPNREGGGNNYFGLQAYEVLKEMIQTSNIKQLNQHTLMKLVEVEKHETCFFIEGQQEILDAAISQFSTFGAAFYHHGKIVRQGYGGMLVRTKRESSNEGGVARNLSVLSPVKIVTI